MKELERELKDASFCSESMTYFLDGGKRWTDKKRLAQQVISRDAILMKDRFFDLTSSEAREKTMSQVKRAHEIRKMARNKDSDFALMFDKVLDSYDRSLSMRLYVHEVLFRETIWGQGTEAQWNKYKDAIDNYNIIGCFAMTELGHSSFLRGLETTATFDAKNQEFVIHTPTLLGTKWWIGMAGHAATHTVVLAKLVVDGKEKGLHWFLVRLRDNEGNVMPGVSAGFLGERVGRHGLDNGWIQFSQVRVPMDNMLSRWGSVSKEGKYTPPDNMTVSYAPLIGERLAAVHAVYDSIAQAVTIATRYSINRLQGPNNEQIMEYQTHQRLLMPTIALAYTANIVGRKVTSSWHQVQQRYQRPDAKLAEHTADILDHHAIAAALKTYFGWLGTEGLENCRRALGGHAFSSYNAIGGLIADFAVITTGGGDNYILARQHVQFLLNTLRKLKSSSAASVASSIKGSMAGYLLGSAAKAEISVTTADDLLHPEKQLLLFEKLAIKSLYALASRIASQVAGGATQTEAWAGSLVQAVECSNLNTLYFIVKTCQESLHQTKTQATSIDAKDQSLYPVLKTLCDLFAMDNMEKKLSHFMEHGILLPSQASLVRTVVADLCKKVRKEAAALVDAFDYPDWLLKAPLGAKHGDMYEKYFETVKAATDGVGVAPYWKQHVQPLVGQSKL